MKQKWNLQDIRPAEPRKKRILQPDQTLQTQTTQSQGQRKPNTEPSFTEKENIPSIIIQDGNKNTKNRLLISIALFVLIVGGAVGLSALLGKTELTIYPMFREPNVNAEFTAYPDKREDSLSYEIMTLESTSESQVKASGQVQVEEQATGMVEIVKTTPGAERLIKNTRFQTPDGLVFRIQESVVVPGSIKDTSGASVPGTIQAEVFADEVGEQYNVKAGTKFSVPGFKEGGYTALFNAISARNVNEFTGGYNGPQYKIDDNELATARQALQIELRNNLLARIDIEKPADYVVFEEAVGITYTQLPTLEYGDDLVTIKEQAILQVPLFKKEDFGAFLAKETVATYEGNKVRVDDATKLSFRYTLATTSSRVLANQTSLTFNLSGKPLLIWEYDADQLTSDLAGLPKTAINNAVLAYPGIDGAKVHMTPFWQRTFPKSADDIIVIEELKDPE